MRTLRFAALTLGLVTLSLPARAQETPVEPMVAPTSPGGDDTTIQRAAPLPVAPPPAAKPVPLLDERTAYMVGRHTLKLGILAFEYGITHWLSIGSDPPAWALRSVTDVWVPNLHGKVQLLDRDPVAIAALAAGYYARIKNTDAAKGDVVVVPLSLFATVRATPRFYVHGEGTYVLARAFGAGDVSKAEWNGAAAARAGQAGLMLQYRLTRIFSLTATGRYQFYTADVPFNGTGSVDNFTTANVSGQIVPGIQHPWEAIGGIAVLWKHFHLIAGGGYGYYFVPGLDIPNTKKTFVPDLSLSVVL